MPFREVGPCQLFQHPPLRTTDRLDDQISNTFFFQVKSAKKRALFP